MRKHWFSLLVFVVITAFLISPSQMTSADYVGPNRQKQVCTRELDCCHYSYRNTNPICSTYGYSGSPCTCTINCVNCITGIDSCLSSVPVLQVQAHCGGSGWTQIDNWKSYEETCQTQTLPEATIMSETLCKTIGNDGWCREGATIHLTANEPVSQKVITYFEATGNQIICDPNDSNSVSCDYDLGDGMGSITAWAHSSYGDTTRQTTAQYKVDTTMPEHNIILPIADGEEGWYRQPVYIENQFASDATSGLAYQEIQLNILSRSNEPLWVDEDGNHTLHYFSEDNAGNSRVSSFEIRLDQTAPQLMTTLPIPDGESGWFRSPVDITLSADDVTSGIFRTWYIVSGQEIDGSSLRIDSDGVHSLQYFAVDKAGNEISSDEMFISVDLTQPELFVDDPNPTDSYLHGEVIFSGEALDATSGVAAMYWVIDEDPAQMLELGEYGDWQFGWDTLSVSEGEHRLTIYVEDLAGNQQSWSRTFQISNRPPTVLMSKRWYVGEIGAFTVTQGDLPLENVRLVISSVGYGEETIQVLPQDYGVEISIQWDQKINGNLMPPGEYKVVVYARDIAGQQSTDEGLIIIPERVVIHEATPKPLTKVPEVTQTPSPIATGIDPTPFLDSVTPTEDIENHSMVVSTKIFESTEQPSKPVIAVEKFDGETGEQKPYVWFLLLGLFLIFGLSGCIDPRPHALKKVEDVLNNLFTRGDNV